MDELRAIRAYRETQHTNRLLVARSTEHALTLLRAFSNGLRFGLVLLDMHAPRLGAADLLRRIRKDPLIHDTSVVILAPPNQPEDSIEAVAENADGWAKKPETTAEFCSLLNGLLERYLGVRSKATCKEAGR